VALKSLGESWMADNDCIDKLDIVFPTCKDDNNMRQLGMLVMILCINNVKTFYTYIKIYTSQYRHLLNVSESDITKVTSM